RRHYPRSGDDPAGARSRLQSRGRLIALFRLNHISRNELAVAEERRSEWSLFRLWNFAREPKAFELHPPLDAHVSLTATSFQASFH
ncbi:hypothetical protein SAMN05878503_1456, partial [Cereibacter ovatus]